MHGWKFSRIMGLNLYKFHGWIFLENKLKQRQIKILQIYRGGKARLQLTIEYSCWLSANSSLRGQNDFEGGICHEVPSLLPRKIPDRKPINIIENFLQFGKCMRLHYIIICIFKLVTAALNHLPPLPHDHLSMVNNYSWRTAIT